MWNVSHSSAVNSLSLTSSVKSSWQWQDLYTSLMVDSDVVTARVSFVSFTVPSNIIIWFYSMQKFRVCFFRSKMWNASRFCVSSLRRGHANLLCIVPILVYVPPKQVHLGKVSGRSHDKGVFHHTWLLLNSFQTLLFKFVQNYWTCMHVNIMKGI